MPTFCPPPYLRGFRPPSTYAGAYAFGRRRARVALEGGRKRIVRGLRRDPSAWEVLIKDHHEGYISWKEYERNQRLIGDNANGKSYRGRVPFTSV